VEGRLGFVAFELDRVVGVSDDDVIDLLEQRRRSGPPGIAELSRTQPVEVRREDGCGVALNRELAASNAEADRAHAFDPTAEAMTSIGLGAGWSKERSLFRQSEASLKYLHALRSAPMMVPYEPER
jgi:hypothetical protein